jgi:hypothetical protein
MVAHYSHLSPGRVVAPLYDEEPSVLAFMRFRAFRRVSVWMLKPDT